jgi:hypothetical protein
MYAGVSAGNLMQSRDASHGFMMYAGIPAGNVMLARWVA